MEKVKIDDVLKYEQPTNYLVENEDYNDSFETPVLTAGKTFLLGKTNEKSGIYNNVPVIIFDDFTTAFHYVDFPFKVKSSAMKILKNVEEKSDLKYLYYKMQTISIDTNLHKRYWISKYSQIKIKLPPLPAQQKIAAILDQAEAIIQNNRAIVQKYDALTQSLFLDMFGDPVRNEKGWKIDILKNLCLKITDGTHFSPEPQKDGFPYVTAKHVKSCGLDFYSKPTFVSEEAHSEIYKRCTPEFGDVLYIKDGATTGIACLNTFNEPISLLSSLALLKPNYKILNNYYLCYWLNNSKVKLKLLGEFMSGAAIQRYTLTKINSFQLIIPPIELQYQFAERVAMIEAQKQQAQLELAKSEELFASLLQRAFNGELN